MSLSLVVARDLVPERERLGSNYIIRIQAVLPMEFQPPPGHPGLPAATCIYVVGLLPIELNVLLLFFVLRR